MMKLKLVYIAKIVLVLSQGDLRAQYQKIVHDNISREFIYYSPPELNIGAPLVFVLHGYTSDAAIIQDYSKMNEVADDHGFAVCYPRGTIDDRGNRFWNVGYDFHQGVNVDDVGFLEKLAQYLQNKYGLSQENTFATGMSNGGEMCYLLACKSPDSFKAIAPVAGMMLQTFFEICNKDKPIPIFEIHGTKDEINRFDGDIEGNDGWGAYPDIPFTIDFWVNANACTSTEIDTLPNIIPADSSFVISEKHLSGINDNQVWFYKVVNGGHDWPGASGNLDFDTSKEVWSFFSKFLVN